MTAQRGRTTNIVCKQQVVAIKSFMSGYKERRQKHVSSALLLGYLESCWGTLGAIKEVQYE